MSKTHRAPSRISPSRRRKAAMITFRSENSQSQAGLKRTMGPESDVLKVSALAGSVVPSATLAAGAKARQLQAAGTTVYDFSLGEPDQATPEHIARAAADAVRAGHTHYTPVAGVPELRSAIVNWY